MRTSVLALIALIASLTTGTGPALAAIHAQLEAPTGFASQVANVQGWAYTTNPGAELIQPFDVLIDGVKVQQVPCCSDRGDVRDAHPAAPLQSGFSGVINWSRPALEADGPVVVTVVIRDTSGESVTVEETVDLYPVASFPFTRHVAFSEYGSPDSIILAARPAADGPAEPIVIEAHRIESRCRLNNVIGVDGEREAQLSCTGLVAENGDSEDVCEGETRFSWDRASQGFKQSSYCEEVERWTDNGDGTATDNETGLMWELKTGEAEDNGVHCVEANDFPSCDDPHDVNNEYDWSETGGLRNGSAFLLFLAELNGNTSANGSTTKGCFAGYCDWRLPTVDELEAIAGECDGGVCTSIPGATAPHWYWSQTDDAGQGGQVWDLNFETGNLTSAKKSFFDSVRAVRGGMKRQKMNQLIAF